MKVSKYNITINNLEEEGYGIVYNTLSRRYVLYDKYKEKLLIDTLDNINKSECSAEETEMIEKALKAGLVVKDIDEEVDKINLNEHNKGYNEEHLKLMLSPITDSKFKCIYCYRNNIKRKVEVESERNILKIIDNVIKDIKLVNVVWILNDFLIEFDRLLSISDKIRHICRRNNFEYKEEIISSGYSFSDKVIRKIKAMNISRLQISIKGTEKMYDEGSPILNEGESFRNIYENILKLLKNRMPIILRCNIDNRNYGNVLILLETIPKVYRELVSVSLKNSQHDKRKMSFYYLYKVLIDRGYKYDNDYITCEEYFENGCTIDSSGKLIVGDDYDYSEYTSDNLGEKDNVIISKFNDPNKLEIMSVLDNKECLDCVELPLCVVSNKLGKIDGTSECISREVDGLELNERILLEYYYDKKRNLIEDKVI